MRETVSLLVMWTGIAIAMYGVGMPIVPAETEGFAVLYQGAAARDIQGAVGQPWYVRQMTTKRQC